ncbi:hypothetical protein CYY_000755 [Polysphondylium violaceum]|uniref:Uncharacterized protein n=1 Tax=Polysphondylium violaceum TaxID=133409 RepID=A0A8J4V260_9MYCE|nr:hypothetical protein CYY_000755 [Polysphondylium violaceum]
MSPPILFNHPDHLPKFFGKLQIIGTADQEIKKYRALHATDAALLKMGQVTPTLTKVTQQPLLNCSKEVQAAYQNNDFATIKKLEAKAQSDVQPVFDNIMSLGDKAWTKVKSTETGEEYYMSWSKSAAVWSYTPAIRPSTADEIKDDPNAKFQAVAQFGTYSQTSEITGTQKFDLGLPEKAVESVISLIISQTLSTFLPQGLNFLASQFAEKLSQFAVEKGLEFFKFVIPEAWMGPVTMSVVFVLVFIGLKVLYDWLNRKYTIRVQVFNWDNQNDWQLTTQALSNAVNPGKEKNTLALNINIDKMIDPQNVTYPPDFKPNETLECTVFYAVIIYENDATFAQGCEVYIYAFLSTCAKQKRGITYAFSCPRFSDNGQYMEGAVLDPANFLKTASTKWSHDLKIKVTAAGINEPVTACMSALSGADENIYDVNIQLNKDA